MPVPVVCHGDHSLSGFLWKVGGGAMRGFPSNPIRRFIGYITVVSRLVEEQRVVWRALEWTGPIV